MGDFEDSLIASPAIRRLEALMPGGLDGVDKAVRRALREDDYSTALREANARYARRGAHIYAAALAYACLLVGRELVVEARGVLVKALEIHGRDPALVALLADALVLEGDIEQASEELSTLEPDAIANASVASFIADVYLDLGDEDEGIAFYQRAIDLRVDDPEPAIRLGQLYLGRDQLREAAEAYQFAARRAKNRAGLWQATADMWFELGEAFEGYQARQRVLELTDAGADPTEEANKWLELGYGLAEFGSLDDALQALSKAEHLDPFAIEPLLIRGHVLLAMGRAEDAMAAFQKVEAQSDEHPDAEATAQRGIAEAALVIGDLMLAETSAERAVELAPADPDAHHVQGRTLQQFGRHEKAIEAFRSALVLDQGQAVYSASLALSLTAVGRITEAKAALEAAVEICESHPEQLPLLVDESAWQRLQARLDPADWALIEQKLAALETVLGEAP
jgi:tetratricopeptide (TPR) repeat protein